MSSKTFDQAIGYMPRAMRTGPGNEFRTVMSRILEAIADAREAEGEYKRQVSQGIEPSKAVKAAFDKTFAGR